MELPTFIKDIKPPGGLQLAAESNSSECVYELEGDIYALNLVDLEREGLVEYKYLLKQIENVKKGSQSNLTRNRSNQDLDNHSNLNSNNIDNNNTISNNDLSITSNSNNRLNKSNSVISTNLNNNVNSSVLNSNINKSNLNNNSESNLKTRSSASSVSNQKYQSNPVPAASSLSSHQSPSPQQSQSPQDERQNDLFDLIDIDSNNTISLGEAEKLFERLTNRLGRRYGENEVKEFFSYIDLNEDGRVDFSEFRRVFQEQI